jgi:endoglucanase
VHPQALKGTNLSGAEYGNGTGPVNTAYVYPTLAELDYYSKKGFTVIRMPFDANRVQPVRSAALSATELALMDSVVQAAQARGLSVILDPHNYGQLKNSSGVARVIGVDPDMPAGQLADFWSRMATHYLQQNNVLFGLMNEPYIQTAPQWQAVAVASVQAIRATGASQKILIPGTSWTGAGSWVSSGNAAAWVGFKDPNFAFEVHQYLDSDNSGTHTPCTQGAGSTRLTEFEKWATANSVQGFLGEFAWTTDPTCSPEAQALMNELSTHPTVWAGWTYWAGGPWLGTYMFNLDPADLGGAVVTDRPQMSLLLSHL